MTQVIHNEPLQRFETGQEPDLAVLTYQFQGQGNRVVFDHTYVPTSLRGKGIGGLLARAALKEARERGWRVIPQCWFVAEFIERNPEFQALL